MYNSLLEITKDLQETFDNSADLTVRTLILQAPERRKAAVITLEGMVDKEGLAQAFESRSDMP